MLRRLLLLLFVLSSVLSRQAAADEHNLILVGRNERTLESAADELRRSVTVHTVAEDLSEPGAAHRVFDRVSALGVEVGLLDQ